MTATVSPEATEAPTAIGSSATVPALWAVISFSIFIASITAMSAPSSTCAPCSTATEAVVSPLQGTVLKVAVEEGEEVDEGALICVIEAMKMENEITAHRAGKVTALPIAEGASVAAGDLLAKIE